MMKKVLVVDDSKSWLDFHCMNLRLNFSDKIEIDEAICAREAYDWVYSYVDNPYDVIITDLQMESDFGDKFAGEWLIEQIKLIKQYNNTEIVIVSGSSQIKYIAENLGVDYIPKLVAAKDLSIYSSFFESFLN